MKKDKRILIPMDEFGEEASEGLGRLSREEAEADLDELKTRMDRRLRKPRAIWLPAAAAVVILLVASAIFVTMFRERPVNEPGLAIAEQAIEDTAYIAMAGPIEKAKNSSSAAGVTGPGEPGAQAERAAKEIVEEPADELFAMAEEEVVAEDAVAEIATDEPVVSVFVAREELNEVVVVEAIPQAMASARKVRADTETREVAGARNEKKAAAAKEEAEKAEPAAGASAPVINTPAIPLGGWEKYEAWAEGNIRYPAGIQPVMQQEVVVSFTVQPDSTLSELKAVRSPGEPFTREAFRLLREGPEWVPAVSGGKVVAGVVMVKVVFK